MYESYPYLIPIPIVYLHKQPELKKLITNWSTDQDNYEKIFKKLGIRRLEMPIVMMKFLQIDNMVGELYFDDIEFLE